MVLGVSDDNDGDNGNYDEENKNEENFVCGHAPTKRVSKFWTALIRRIDPLPHESPELLLSSVDICVDLIYSLPNFADLLTLVLEFLIDGNGNLRRGRVSQHPTRAKNSELTCSVSSKFFFILSVAAVDSS